MTEPTTRERLIGAGRAHLAERGLDGLTLRSIARAAGVSHAAPARHFPGVASLLTAIATGSFDRLDATVRHYADRADRAGHSPIARLRAAGDGYVAFAIANAAEYELMFRPERLDTDDPDYRRAADAAFATIEELVGAAQAAGWHPATDRGHLTGVVWAGVHGIASLWAQGVLPITGATDPTELTSALAEVLRLNAEEAR